jgi:hypothetical protein
MDGASCLRGRTKYQPSPWASQTWAKRSSRRTVCTDFGQSYRRRRRAITFEMI